MDIRSSLRRFLTRKHSSGSDRRLKTESANKASTVASTTSGQTVAALSAHPATQRNPPTPSSLTSTCNRTAIAQQDLSAESEVSQDPTRTPQNRLENERDSTKLDRRFVSARQSRPSSATIASEDNPILVVQQATPTSEDDGKVLRYPVSAKETTIAK